MNQRRALISALRWCAVTAAIAAVGACTDVTGGAAELIRQTAAPHPGSMPTREQVAAKPYAQMYARTPSGAGVLILGNRDGERAYWYGRDHVLVVTRHGRIVQTAGLPENLEGVHAAGPASCVRDLRTLAAPVTCDLVEDWSGYRYGIPVSVRIEPRATTRLTVLGKDRRVLHVRETVDAPAAHWHAVNQYWVGVDDGVIWKSIQHVVPGMPITLLQLRPEQVSR